MCDHFSVLADCRRVRQWPALAITGGVFAAGALSGWLAEGIPWAARRVGDFGFATSALPNWIFEDAVRASHADAVAAHLDELRGLNEEQLRFRFRDDRERLRFGRSAVRLVWAVHAAVLAQKSSRVVLAERVLARAVWGADQAQWPKNWCATLAVALASLARLHVVDDWVDGVVPASGWKTAVLLNYSRIPAGTISCPPGCSLTGRTHRHFQIDVGRGLLGVLEAFAEPDPGAPGVRRYRFPEGKRPRRGRSRKERSADPVGQTLRAVGATGRLVTVYLPAYLGEPEKAKAFSPDQIRLLQALVRERTRRRQESMANGATNRVAPFYRGSPVPCSHLPANSPVVDFNGNGRRAGHGYRLKTSGGWLAKAGYGTGQIDEFLGDLDVLAGRLGLIVVGIGSGNQFYTLAQLRAMAGTTAGRMLLVTLHVRAYARFGFEKQWNAVFGWNELAPEPGSNSVISLGKLKAEIPTAGLSIRGAARRAGMDPSFTAKVLAGKKPAPTGFADRIRAALVVEPTDATSRPPQARPACPALAAAQSAVEVADALYRIGWNVFPQRPRTKHPYIRWSMYHHERPTWEFLRDKFHQFPDAGVVVAPGPVSDLFVIDVDGPEARAELERRLGSIPQVPKVLSGSGMPDRFHLFFRYPPGIATKPVITPWHPKLEFRGFKGLVVLPPSTHKSGHSYRWAPGQSLSELPLTAPPDIVVAALRENASSRESRAPRRRETSSPCRRGGSVAMPIAELDCAPSTRRFLDGEFGDGPRWNDRLFRAACDLAARGIPIDIGEELLLAGAKPWNDCEEAAARATIHSAYSRQREPSLA
jgi:hypothetical protein